MGTGTFRKIKGFMWVTSISLPGSTYMLKSWHSSVRTLEMAIHLKSFVSELSIAYTNRWVELLCLAMAASCVLFFLAC